MMGHHWCDKRSVNTKPVPWYFGRIQLSYACEQVQGRLALFLTPRFAADIKLEVNKVKGHCLTFLSAIRIWKSPEDIPKSKGLISSASNDSFSVRRHGEVENPVAVTRQLRHLS